MERLLCSHSNHTTNVRTTQEAPLYRPERAWVAHIIEESSGNSSAGKREERLNTDRLSLRTKKAPAPIHSKNCAPPRNHEISRHLENQSDCL